MQTPEVNQIPTPNGESDVSVQERQENIELSPAVQSTGAQATDDKFTTQVTDDSGNNLTQPSDDAVAPAITIPKNQQTLANQSKGDTNSGSTWNAVFLLRFVKKALQLGKKVLFGNG